MARMRSMKPEYFKDQDLAADLPGPRGRDARLLYAGLWTLADEHGRLRGDARSIKGELYAYDDDLTPEEVDGLIDMLAETGRAVRYTVGRSVYLFLPKLAKHQRLEPSKVPSRLPEPPPDQPQQSNRDSSEKIPDESARDANKLPLKQAASSREHVAGSRPAKRGAAHTPPGAAIPAGAAEAAEIVIDATACPPYLAAEVVLAIARERKPRKLPALVRTMAKAGDLGEWLAKAQALIDAEAAKATAAAARASPPCPHDQPGGLEPIASTGKPRCPQCRSGASP